MKRKRPSQVSQAADLYSGMVERLKGLGLPKKSRRVCRITNAANELAQAERDAQLASARGDESGLAEAQSKADEALSRHSRKPPRPSALKNARKRRARPLSRPPLPLEAV